MAAGADAKQIKALEGQVQRLERELGVVRTEMRSTVLAARTFAEKARHDLTLLQAVVTQHGNRLDAIATAGQTARTDINALQATVATHTTQLGQAQTALQNHASRLTSLEARVTALGG